MTAAGKTTVARLTTGTRFLITDESAGRAASADPDPAGRWYVARNKTRMVIATFVKHNPFSGSRGRSSFDLVVTLPTGETAIVADQVAHQTVWLAPEPAAAPAASEGKTLGEMSPDERAATIRRAADRMQDELNRDADAIGAVLLAATVPNRAHGVPADTTLSGTVPAGFTGSTVIGTASSGRPVVVAYVEHHDVTDQAAPASPTTADGAGQIRADGGVMEYVSHLRSGDVVTMPGETVRRTVNSNTWDGPNGVHRLVFNDCERYAIPAQAAPDVVLYERPGYGPFDAVYKVGDRVAIFFSGRESIDVVTAVHTYPELDLAAYETRSGAVASPWNMRRESDIAIGQVWRTRDGKHTLHVTSFDTDHGVHGLAVVGDPSRGDPRGSFIITDKHWEQIKTRPDTDPDPLLPLIVVLHGLRDTLTYKGEDVHSGTVGRLSVALADGMTPENVHARLVELAEHSPQKIRGTVEQAAATFRVLANEQGETVTGFVSEWAA